MPPLPGRSPGGSLSKPVPPVVIGVTVVLGVIALGAGVFYLVNGGWKTESQKEWEFQHETAPLIAARRGRPEMLEEENARRRAVGQPELQVRDRHQAAGEMRQKLQDLQSRMHATPSPGAGP